MKSLRFVVEVLQYLGKEHTSEPNTLCENVRAKQTSGGETEYLVLVRWYSALKVSTERREQSETVWDEIFLPEAFEKLN